LKAAIQANKFQVSVEYLTDYSGVKGAVITDSEGLVISHSPGKDFDAELCGAVSLELVHMLDKNLRGMAKPGCEYFSMKTGTDWITVAKASAFYVVVLADRKADDLLNVRISRAVEMITSYLKEKYPAVLPAGEQPARGVSKKMEASNV